MFMLLTQSDTGYRHIVYEELFPPFEVKLWGIKGDGTVQGITLAESGLPNYTGYWRQTSLALYGDTVFYTDDDGCCRRSTLDGKRTAKLSDYPLENTNGKGDAFVLIDEKTGEHSKRAVVISGQGEEREIVKIGRGREYSDLESWGWSDDNRLFLLLKREGTPVGTFEVLIYDDNTRELYSPTDEKGRRITVMAPDHIYWNLYCSPDGSKLVYIQYLGDYVTWHNVVMLSMDTGESKIICSTEEENAFLSGRFSIVWNKSDYDVLN